MERVEARAFFSRRLCGLSERLEIVRENVRDAGLVSATRYRERDSQARRMGASARGESRRAALR